MGYGQRPEAAHGESTGLELALMPVRRPTSEMTEARLTAQGTGSLALGELTPADITSFVVAELPGRRTGSAKLTAAALRSLLRSLHVEGYLPARWSSRSPCAAL